jgi:fatty acid desaturase
MIDDSIYAPTVATGDWLFVSCVVLISLALALASLARMHELGHSATRQEAIAFPA